MPEKVNLGAKAIGRGCPLFITAECGVTCNYDLKLSKELIDVTAEAGADAIKFIFWFPEEIMSDREVDYTYQTVEGTKSENMFQMLQKLRFDLETWKELKAYADQKGVILFSTVNSPSGVSWAEELGLVAYKLSSWDFNYVSLWRRIARLGKPMIIDTGPVHLDELAAVLRLMAEEGNDQAVLVHCYHTELPAEKNLRSIPFLRRTFGVPSGFSSPDTRDEPDMAAIGLGASFLEKRLTMSRRLPGHHHILSKEPGEFIQYVKTMRELYDSLGEYALKPSPGDLKARREFFRRLVAARDLPAGTVLSEDMLAAMRPERGGISPEYLEFFLGRTLKRELKALEPISWDDV